MTQDTNSLAHTKWNCKYHIVFEPKYRRKVIYRQLKADIGATLRELYRWKQVNIVEAELCPDHIHMLVEIPHGKRKSKPTIRRRKNLLDCSMTDILYDAYQRVIAPNHTMGVRA